MKAERRHELRENVLAHQLGRMKLLFTQYGNWIFGGVVVIALVFAVVWWYHNRAQSQLAREEGELRSLLSDAAWKTEKVNGLVNLAENAKSGGVATQAALELGNYYYNTQYLAQMADPNAVRNPEPRQKAERFFRLVIDKHADHPFAVAKAYYALGVMCETAGELDNAKVQYAGVAKLVDARESVWLLAREALRRLENPVPPRPFPTTTQASQPGATTAASQPTSTGSTRGSRPAGAATGTAK